MSTAPLFLVDALPPGEHVVLDGPEGRHAATVRRLRAGEGLVLADGRGGIARAVVEAVAKDALELRVVERRTLPLPAPRVVLAQALVKGDRGELAVVPGTSHVLLVEKPELLTRLVLDFLTTEPVATIAPIRRARG